MRACMVCAALPAAPESCLLLCRRARSVRRPPLPSPKAPVNWETVKAHLMTAPASALRLELVDGKLVELRDYQIQACCSG